MPKTGCFSQKNCQVASWSCNQYKKSNKQAFSRHFIPFYAILSGFSPFLLSLFVKKNLLNNSKKI